jgi:DNA modification methylase
MPASKLALTRLPMSSPVRYSTSPAPWVPGALLYQAECLPILRSLPPASVAAVVTDPPYGLSDVSFEEVVRAITAWASGDRGRVPNGKGFMGNEWDRFVPPPAVWDECFRILKPGGYMAVFAGSRTADLMGLSIRLAGFEMRDTITWMYGSGFPKSLDVGKAIDKTRGVERKENAILSTDDPGMIYGKGKGNYRCSICNKWKFSGSPCQCPKNNKPVSEEAKKWDGWGTALKPAGEPIIVARKPLEGTVAANVLKHDTGGMNIDGCRVAFNGDVSGVWGNQQNGELHVSVPGNHGNTFDGGPTKSGVSQRHNLGRWPANVVLSHTEWCDEGYCEDGCPIAELDAQSGIMKDGVAVRRNLPTDGKDQQVNGIYGSRARSTSSDVGFGGSGGASRFFNTFCYQAKAPRSERPVVNGVVHPTVKPLALMEWLVTLFTPPYGVVLDPFAGSGTTGHAALRLGFNSIMVERDLKYKPLIDKRLGDYLATLAAKTPA